MKILHLDENHPLLIKGLEALGYENHTDFKSSKEDILSKIGDYEGLIIRSRIPVDAQFLTMATKLKFIGRVGAGLENIDVEKAQELNIRLFNAPEGNRNAVGEQALGMLLSLLNHLNRVDKEVREGVWKREENRGIEIEGKTVGIIGYGNMGKAFAKKLKGFDCEVICYDIQGGVGDENARQVGIMEFKKRVDILSLHTPQTPKTVNMINAEFVDGFHKPFWLINTARGKSVVTQDLVDALKSGKILGAGLDVLEYEKASFENLFGDDMPEAFQYLIQADNVLLSPHIAGWTIESKIKLSQTILDKITQEFSLN
ncbi:2-hydroxyacid dehydrogenase [Galbibacter sp.]|uniref:2-hydroxyacid dehydrogenase n=1 Tax=Galbibacter sp. TaxID=2918471 RepID=UPI003A8EA521